MDDNTPVARDTIGLAATQSDSDGLTFFCSADRVPSRAGQTDMRTCEGRARKRRGNERHAVGCYKELARPVHLPRPKRTNSMTYATPFIPCGPTSLSFTPIRALDDLLRSKI
jgi:hypothetical protein